MPHPKRTALLMLFDVVLINIAVFGSFYLRFYDNSSELVSYLQTTYRYTAVTATVVLLMVFYFFGMYQNIWRYASIPEMLNIVYAGGIGTALTVTVVYFVAPLRVPHGVSVLLLLTVTSLVGFSRFLPRVQQLGPLNKERDIRLFRTGEDGTDRGRGGDKRILIVGAGDAGALALRELRNREYQNGIPVGFVDDSPEKLHLKLQGVPVLGTRYDIPRLVERHAIDEIIIALPSVTGDPLREIITICQDTQASLKILPGVYDILSGDITVSKIREVQVEDLLQRDPVSLNIEEVAGYLQNQTILVTGAGGSIGSELCRQLIQFGPARLIMAGHGENTIFDIEQELAATLQGVANSQRRETGEPRVDATTADDALTPRPILTDTVIMDIRDEVKVNRVFRKYQPTVVFHAAAHKHVPLMEKNPEQALANNVFGTFVLASAAHAAGVKTFVFVSTDKAVNPTSIMGASKRLAEMVIQDFSTRSATKFAAVRFGNVLGSRGSVIPTFKRQIAAGGPVTVTDPAMTRYFMTIPEASQLVIQAGAMAQGGEIFILDMGKPVKIVDLAKDLIRLSGLKEDRDIKIVYTGIRPGEKLFEELLTTEEGTSSTRHKRIFVARPNHIDHEGVARLTCLLAAKSSSLEEHEVIELIRDILPDFRAQQQAERPS